MGAMAVKRLGTANSVPGRQSSIDIFRQKQKATEAAFHCFRQARAWHFSIAIGVFAAAFESLPTAPLLLKAQLVLWHNPISILY